MMFHVKSNSTGEDNNDSDDNANKMLINDNDVDDNVGVRMLPECGRCSAAPRSVTYLLTQLTWPRLDILQLGTPVHSWNNGKEVPRLDLTSSTMPGQQIHMVDHTRTANPCDWLPCRLLPCRAPIGWLSPLSCLFTSPSC